MISIFNIKTEEEYLKNKEYVDINELDNSERDALTVALKNSDIDKAKWLIKNGLKCDFLNVYGESLLVGRDNVEIINLLIGNGTNVNNRNNDSETALFRANETLTKELIKHGIDVNIVDNMGFDS